MEGAGLKQRDVNRTKKKQRRKETAGDTHTDIMGQGGS